MNNQSRLIRFFLFFREIFETGRPSKSWNKMSQHCNFALLSPELNSSRSLLCYLQILIHLSIFQFLLSLMSRQRVWHVLENYWNLFLSSLIQTDDQMLFLFIFTDLGTQRLGGFLFYNQRYLPQRLYSHISLLSTFLKFFKFIDTNFQEPGQCSKRERTFSYSLTISLFTYLSLKNEQLFLEEDQSNFFQKMYQFSLWLPQLTSTFCQLFAFCISLIQDPFDYRFFLSIFSSQGLQFIKSQRSAQYWFLNYWLLPSTIFLRRFRNYFTSLELQGFINLQNLLTSTKVPNFLRLASLSSNFLFLLLGHSPSFQLYQAIKQVTIFFGSVAFRSCDCFTVLFRWEVWLLIYFLMVELILLIMCYSKAAFLRLENQFSTCSLKICSYIKQQLVDEVKDIQK